jgi:hypothetical protein
MFFCQRHHGKGVRQVQTQQNWDENAIGDTISIMVPPPCGASRFDRVATLYGIERAIRNSHGLRPQEKAHRQPKRHHRCAVV